MEHSKMHVLFYKFYLHTECLSLTSYLVRLCAKLTAHKCERIHI